MRGPVVGIVLLVLGILPSPPARAVPPAATTASEPAATPASDSRAVRADSLYRAAQARLTAGGIDRRRVAMQQLKEAVALAPDDVRLRLAYGRVCLESGFDAQARGAYERAAALDPRSGAAHLGLGQVWKRDWIRTLDTLSFARASHHLSAATELDPAQCEAWLLLAPLLFERGRPGAALAAAQRARDACPDRGEAQLAVAYLTYRSGQVERAQGLFEAALPRLPLALRARFEDITPLLRPLDGEALHEMTSRQRAEYERRFWSEADPDPATPENEARLEYWTRVAHVTLVFLDLADPAPATWDTRAELYVRYGAPDRVAYQPPGSPMAQRPNKNETWTLDRYGNPRRIGEPMWFPLHSQEWDYAALGMTAFLLDYSLSGHYQLPMGRFAGTDPVPDPRALARSDLLATAGGHAVFPTLPPGVKPLHVAGCIMRFEGLTGPRLLAQIEAPGTPEDSLWAQCVVVDSSEHVVARASRNLSPSGCDPTALRTGDFTFDVPPGIYRVAFSVRDGTGARGVTRATAPVAAVPAALSMSDVVVTCGPIDIVRQVPEVRLGPNLRSRVAGNGPLIAYFEIYHMAPGADGQARFEYEYSVESEDKDPRPWFRRLLSFGAREPHYLVRSEDVNVGPLRRQFITVPVQSLKPGRYRLEVRVRDLGSGATTTGSARFERMG